ncbi:MAG TPA: type IV pilus secretin PilQ [Myxococcota bacterium]|nr:type IV pilus secretin PilQ [Myxococcota bacterium]
MTIRKIVGRVATLALVTTLALAAGPLAAQDPEGAIKSVQVDATTSGAEVTFVVPAAVAASASHFTMDEGLTIIVDIPGAVVSDISKARGSGMVDRVELAQSADGATATARIFLTSDAADVEILQDGDTLTLMITAGAASSDPLLAASSESGKLRDQLGRGEEVDSVSGPTDVRGRALSSLDFENLDDTSRIVIGTSGSVDYTTSQPEPTLVVVDIPGATLPSSLSRVLDTSEFLSPVRMVRAYSTSTGVRVAVSLRQNTEWSVRAGADNLLYIDVEIPPSMLDDRDLAKQGFSAVSPSGPENTEEGLSGYSSSETLIGQSGRTVDPQKAFGSGMGSQEAAALAGTSLGFMFDMTSATDVPYSGRRINIDLVDADIHSVFRLISHVSRLNIVAGDDVTGTVTVRLEDVPWDQALAAILQAKGLGAQRFGNIVRVAPIETIKSEQQAALEAQRAKEELTPLKVLVVPLNYSSADDIKAELEKLISNRGSVQVDERGNQLIIKETEERLAQMRELLRHIDQATPQVQIEARIVEATSTFTKAMGVQWGGFLDASPTTGYGTGLFFPSTIGLSGAQSGSGQQGTVSGFDPTGDNLAVDLPVPSGGGSLAIALGSVPGLVELDARLQLMETEGWGEIVSAPRITTLDNTTASISQGARIPYLSISAQGTQVQLVQASLDLMVTPHITSDGKIFMTLVVNNNRPDFSTAVQGQPAIQIKEASTELLVADGDTMVIGGVFATEEAEGVVYVPGLGRIPILGALFRSKSVSVIRNEMLVFVTPSIVVEAQQ